MAVAVSEDELRSRLQALFEQNPVCTYDEEVPALPVWALVPILNQLAHDLGVAALSEESAESLRATQQAGGDTVSVRADQVAQIVPHLFPELAPPLPSPSASPSTGTGSPDSHASSESGSRVVFRSRSSSPESGDDRDSVPSAPPADLPKTPSPGRLSFANLRAVNNSGGSINSPGGSLNSPFDVRQRSTPLSSGGSGPSRVRRPVAPSRRRRSNSSSTASVSEDGRPPSPTSGSMSPGSIPPSPTAVRFPLWTPNDGALGAGRSVSQPLPHRRSSIEPQFTSIHELDWEDHPEYNGPNSPLDSDDDRLPRFSSLHNTPRRRTLSWPDRYDSDDDDDEALVHAPRSTRASLLSMAPQDRVNALAAENEDLIRRLSEAERHLQTQIAEQEAEFQDLEAKLSEVEQELAHVRREEKELRHKERGNTTQIGMLEQEILKLQRALDSSRAGSQSLQKMYHDQLAVADSLRNALRAKEADVQYAADLAQEHAADARRHQTARELSDAQAAQLEEELNLAREAFNSMAAQEEENALLHETVERLRADLDELRGATADRGSTNSRDVSRPGTLNRSLGVEMLVQLAESERKKFLDSNGMADRTDLEMAAEDPPQSPRSDDDMTYQTMITTRRKVPSRAMAPSSLSPSRYLPQPSVYADAFAQHQPSTSTAGVQTDDIDTSGSESGSPPEAPSALSSLQLPRTPQRPTTSLPRSLQEQEDYDEDLFKMILAPVSPTSPTRPPKAGELPPSYAQLFSPPRITNPRALAARDAVAHWHRGAKFPLAPIPGGVSRGTMAAWGKLKGELGVECMVIDKIIAASATRTPPASPPHSPSLRRRRSMSVCSSTPATSSTPAPRHSHRTRERTKKAGADSTGWRFSDLWRVHEASDALPKRLFYPIVVLGAWTAVVVVATPFVTHYFSVPGVPEATDRAALKALRTIAGGAGEGFRGGMRDDTIDAVWKVIEMLLLGSASAVLRVPVPT